MKKVKVRIAVAVESNGRWQCVGVMNPREDDMVSALFFSGKEESYAWIEVEMPNPTGSMDKIIPTYLAHKPISNPILDRAKAILKAKRIRQTVFACEIATILKRPCTLSFKQQVQRQLTQPDWPKIKSKNSEEFLKAVSKWNQKNKS